MSRPFTVVETIGKLNIADPFSKNSRRGTQLLRIANAYLTFFGEQNIERKMKI